MRREGRIDEEVGRILCHKLAEVECLMEHTFVVHLHHRVSHRLLLKSLELEVDGGGEGEDHAT
jgi:hypothetical protein